MEHRAAVMASDAKTMETAKNLNVKKLKEFAKKACDAAKEELLTQYRHKTTEYTQKSQNLQKALRGALDDMMNCAGSGTTGDECDEYRKRYGEIDDEVTQINAAQKSYQDNVQAGIEGLEKLKNKLLQEAEKELQGYFCWLACWVLIFWQQAFKSLQTLKTLKNSGHPDLPE